MRQKWKFAAAAYNMFNLKRRKLWNSFSLLTFSSACEQALRSALAEGREKEGELATTSLEFEFNLQLPCGSPWIEQSDFR